MRPALRGGRLRQAETLGAFIYGIARNQLAEALRRMTRDRVGPMPADFDPAGPGADAPPERRETGPREGKDPGPRGSPPISLRGARKQTPRRSGGKGPARR